MTHDIYLQENFLHVFLTFKIKMKNEFCSMHTAHNFSNCVLRKLRDGTKEWIVDLCMRDSRTSKYYPEIFYHYDRFHCDAYDNRENIGFKLNSSLNTKFVN